MTQAASKPIIIDEADFHCPDELFSKSWEDLSFVKEGWKIVIGFEAHAQVNTETKLTSSAPTAFGMEANTQVDFVDAAFPGTLPTINKACIIKGIATSIALNGKIADVCIFDRKHYFYYDLPLGYQITQFYYPLMEHGSLKILNYKNEIVDIAINRLHIEQDAGKVIHEPAQKKSFVDLNRAGICLMEIVSEPVLHHPEDAIAYIKTLHHLLEYIGTCDAKMAEGSFRADLNISITKDLGKFGTRAEIKNLNSFSAIRNAIIFEVHRQQWILEQGGVVHQETRLYNDDTKRTAAMRTKEDSDDYHYFADPDLLPLKITDDLIQDARDVLPVLPQDAVSLMMKDWGLSYAEAEMMIQNPKATKFFLDTCCGVRGKILGKRRFKIDKLIRDIITCGADATFSTKIMNEIEFNIRLKEKLVEEAHEVKKAESCADLIEELADVAEVLSYLNSDIKIVVSETARDLVALKKLLVRAAKELHLEEIASLIGEFLFVLDSTVENLEAARLKKRNFRGGFDKKMYGEFIDISFNNELVQYYTDDYEEISPFEVNLNKEMADILDFAETLFDRAREKPYETFREDVKCIFPLNVANNRNDLVDIMDNIKKIADKVGVTMQEIEELRIKRRKAREGKIAHAIDGFEDSSMDSRHLQYYLDRYAGKFYISEEIIGKNVYNWISGVVFAQQNKDPSGVGIICTQLVDLITLVLKEIISVSVAKKIFALFWNTDIDPEHYVKENNLMQICDLDQLRVIVNAIIEKNQKEVTGYRAGKTQLFQFFVGQGMKTTDGLIHPEKFNAILKESLDIAT